jgi:hypothetical protein
MKNPCRFVAAVATLCFIAGVANAQPTLTAKAPARKGGDAGGNTANVLYCDPYNNGLYGLVSQNFTDYPSVTSCSYDDFTVPDGETWCKEGMGVEGFYNYISNGETTGCVRDYNFKVVGDLAGVPDCGNNVCSFTGPPGVGIETPNVFGQSGGRFDYCPGGFVAMLTPGTYWASGFVTMPFATPTFCGQWYFVTSAQPHRLGGNAYLDNPGGGFGVPPCVNWTFLGQDGDLTFCIYGTVNWTDCPCDVRAGNTDTGNGNPPADTLSIDGSVGNACRELGVSAGSATTIAVGNAPTVGGKGHYGFWILDGVALNCCPTDLCGGKGSFFLGIAADCLPVNNTCVPLSVPCPVTFPTGRTSKSLGAGKAATVCLNKKPGFAKSPTTFSQVFPSGLFTVQGLVQDGNSINSPAKNVGISNAIAVAAL